MAVETHSATKAFFATPAGYHDPAVPDYAVGCSFAATAPRGLAVKEPVVVKATPGGSQKFARSPMKDGGAPAPAGPNEAVERRPVAPGPAAALCSPPGLSSATAPGELQRDIVYTAVWWGGDFWLRHPSTYEWERVNSGSVVYSGNCEYRANGNRVWRQCQPRA